MGTDYSVCVKQEHAQAAKERMKSRKTERRGEERIEFKYLKCDLVYTTGCLLSEKMLNYIKNNI